MLKFRNTPRENGLSPAEMIFSHSLRSILPAHRTPYAMRWQSVMEARERQADIDTSVKLYDERAHPLAPFSIGTNVRIRDPASKLWNRVGVVVDSSVSGATGAIASSSLMAASCGANVGYYDQ